MTRTISAKTQKTVWEDLNPISPEQNSPYMIKERIQVTRMSPKPSPEKNWVLLNTLGKKEKNLLGMKGPRKLQIIIPKYNNNRYTVFKSFTGFESLKESFKNNSPNMQHFINNPPKWSDEHQAFVLDFYNRVEKASVKNFQLVERDDDGFKVLLQFGKIDDNLYNLDYQYPFSLVQAFSIALSSCDNKLLCE